MLNRLGNIMTKDDLIHEFCQKYISECLQEYHIEEIVNAAYELGKKEAKEAIK